MTFYDSVIANLKGVVGSKKDGVLLSHLDDEYNSMTGDYIPIRRLGYDTIYDFLKGHSELFGLQGSGKYCRVVNVVGDIENDTTMNLIDLIQNTQIKYKKKPNTLKINYERKPFVKKIGYKGQNYIPNYHQVHKPGYHPTYNSSYQSTYNSKSHTTYNPSYQSSYNQNYQPSYNSPYKSQTSYDNFRITSTPTSFGFANEPSFNFPGKATIEKPVNETPTPVNRFPGIYLHPNIGLSAGFEPPENNKRTNLLVPIKCLRNSHKTPETDNVLVISDDDETDIVVQPAVSTQTSVDKDTINRRQFATLQSLELVNLLIDVIIEFKRITYDEVVKIKVEGDLCYYFRKLSGLNVDPILFCDYVTCSLDNPKIQYLYKGLIYLDPTKSLCLFNMKSICNTKQFLPHLEFDYKNEYVVEIVKVFNENIVGFKIPTKFNIELNWRKTNFPDQTKEIIESQHFWSWLPGTLCLVRLPESIVKRLNVASIERAVIIYTEIASLDDELLQNSYRYLIHKASFYLIDHGKEVFNIFACASSFNEVKQKAKENNTSNVASVCNMSINAKNTPSKIQFVKLENYKDVSHSFLDDNKRLKPNSTIFLTSMKKMTLVFNFQPMYSSFSRVNQSVEEPRVLNNYTDIEVIDDTSSKIDSLREDFSEIIIISDSEDEEVVAKIPILNGHVDLKKSSTSKSDKVVRITPERIIIPLDKIPLPERIVPLDQIPLPKENAESRYRRDVAPRHQKISFKVSSIKPPLSQSNGLQEIFVPQTNGSLPTNGSKPNHSVTTKETEITNKKSTNVPLKESDHKRKSSHLNDSPIPSSMISYLENNSYNPRKCLIPVTADVTNAFHGRVVKVLHIQMGLAVLMLFDSIKLMKREIKMRSLKAQTLQRAKEIAVGSFFIWHKQNESADGDDYLLVEIMQIVNKTTALINKVHRGLLAIVNIDELFCVPEDKNGDSYTSIINLIGSPIGCFNLHLFPDWFTPEESVPFTNHLFTAFFTVDNTLLLEYFEEPCRFLNLEMISSVEKSLTVNHCNTKSRNFIEMLSKSLLQCRSFVGSILQMIECYDENFDDLPITKVLCKVTSVDKPEVWFGSVLVRSDGGQGGYEKLSPHSFLDDEFCVDRLSYDDRRKSLRLLEHHNVHIEAPGNLEGLYRLERAQVRGSLRGPEECLARYFLAGAALIPDLQYLCNKLIF